MYASTQNHPITYTTLFRNCGRVGGIVVMLGWVTLVIADLFREGAPAQEAYLQAGALAIVFAGYVVGWWKEMLGGTLAVAGTAALFAICDRMQAPMLPEGLWFAAPGVFYMLAHYTEKKHAYQN